MFDVRFSIFKLAVKFCIPNIEQRASNDEHQTSKKMKAYNTQWSENDFIQNIAKKWFQKGFLKKEQYDTIKKEYHSDYSDPNIFLKIGLFIFTILGASFSIGIVSLILVVPFESNYTIGIILQSLFVGIIYIFLLETLIKNNKLYHSGVDNALLYMALGAFCTAVFFMFENTKLPAWLILSFCLPFFIAASIRYADVLVVIATYLLSLTIVILISLESVWGKIFLPFIVMIFSVIAYFFQKKLSRRDDYIYYEKCLDMLKTLSLATLYLGGNYLIVREGNAQINHLSVSSQIAFAPFFYFFTAIIPVVYIFFGLKRQDRLLLVIGLLALGFSIYTYRFYFSILPVEIALTLGGVLMIALAGLCIHHLRTPKYSITSKPDDEPRGLNLESIIMSQVIQNKIPQQGDIFHFGGGDAGGGGAGGEY
jgi:hypothetical protein